MSAFICSDAHLTALASFAARHVESYYHAGGRVPCRGQFVEGLGQLLLEANYRSVNFRYREATPTPRFAPCGPARAALFTSVEIIKAAHCYGYQACEHPEYKGSEAKALITAILDEATRQLPGYEAAPWGVRFDFEPARRGDAPPRGRLVTGPAEMLASLDLAIGYAGLCRDVLLPLRLPVAGECCRLTSALDGLRALRRRTAEAAGA